MGQSMLGSGGRKTSMNLAESEKNHPWVLYVAYVSVVQWCRRLLLTVLQAIVVFAFASLWISSSWDMTEWTCFRTWTMAYSWNVTRSRSSRRSEENGGICSDCATCICCRSNISRMCRGPLTTAARWKSRSPLCRQATEVSSITLAVSLTSIAYIVDIIDFLWQLSRLEQKWFISVSSELEKNAIEVSRCCGLRAQPGSWYLQ